MTPSASAPDRQSPVLPPEHVGTARWRIALRVVMGVALLALVGAIGVRGFARGDFSFAAAPAPTPTSSARGDELGAFTSVPTTPPVPTATASTPPAVPEPAPADPRPSAAHTPELAVTSIDASPSQIMCPTPSATSDSNTYVTISWSTTGGETAYIGVNTSDAAAEPYTMVNLNDSYTLYFPCSQLTQIYTVTVVDAKGNRQSQSVEVSNGGYIG